MSDTERWLPVVGYEGLYEVSSIGTVRRIGKANGATRGRVLETRLNHGGYPSCKLSSEQVIAIRQSTLGARAAGRLYGVHHGTISAIRLHKKWRHV